MFIIDSQVHIWAPETPEKPYAKENASAPHRAVPLGHDELLREMDGAGVSRCILVPPTWEADRNDTSLEAARLHPDRFRVMGKLALTNPNGPALMATWKEQPYMLGIRMVFNRGQSAQWLNDGTADWFWDAAEKYDIPVMTLAPADVPKLGEVAERHPGLRLIVDHMGLNSVLRGKRSDPFGRCRDQTRAPQECRREGFGAALLRRRALSISDSTSAGAPRRRRLRPAALFLGHRSVAPALSVQASGDVCSPRK